MKWAVISVALLASQVNAATTLRYCSEGGPSGFDPSQTDSGVDLVAIDPIFSTLVERERGVLKHIPGLAESWTTSADGRAYTFKLRPGVRFHTTAWFKPTRTFNAEDVVFSFERMLDASHPFQKAYPTVAPYMSYAGWQGNVLKVQRVDELTVRIELKNPDAAFINSLSQTFASIHSAEYAAQLLKAGKPQQIRSQPVGTGPFVFKSYQKDSVVRYERNADYFRPEVPLADKLVFSVTPDAIVRAQRLRKNECDIAALASRSDAVELAKDPAIVLAKAEGLNIGYLVYNTKKPPMDKLEVRQALDLAIDKKALVDTVYAGSGTIARSLMPAVNWAFDATLPAPRHDPARARELLKKAGLENKLEITLWAMPVQRAYNPNGKLMAQMIQADWAKVGVKARIVSYEWGEYLKRIDAGEHDAALTGWNGDAEPSGTAGLLGCGANGGSFWCNKRYDELIAKARATSDRAERKKLYAQAQHLAAEQQPLSPIASGELVVPLRKNVVDFRLDAEGNMRFDGVGLR